MLPPDQAVQREDLFRVRRWTLYRTLFWFIGSHLGDIDELSRLYPARPDAQAMRKQHPDHPSAQAAALQM